MARQRKCAKCGLKKQQSEFPLEGEECLECKHTQPETESIEKVPLHPTQPDEDTTPHTFPHVEIDPSNPTHREIAARFAANKSLLQFIKRFRPKYQVGWVHEDICQRLEQFMRDVEEQKEPRLLLCMPVRHGKSEIASRHFPPFVLGHHPDWEVIAASNAQSLATSFSRYQRDLMRDPSYQAVFTGTQLDPASQSVENWNTTSGGGYLAAGVGTAIIGRGAHVLVIDDPVKDAEAADSTVIRDATWEWFISTAMSRLAPGGGVLIIMTFWNEDDLAGRVQMLSEFDGVGDKYEVVKYPAINEDGDEYIFEDEPGRPIRQIPPTEGPPPGARLTRPLRTALHPARYTLEALLRRKATYYALGQQRWWSALYQQDPSPQDGVFFTKDMITTFTHRPTHGTVLQAWDFAITDKQKTDWTVGVTGILDEYDTLYVIDVWRFKTDDGIELGTGIATYAQQWSCMNVAVEDGQIWKSIKANFEKACTTAKHYPAITIVPSLTDKRTRAQPARGRMQQHKVQFLNASSWFEILKNEFLRFMAGGKHDDIVDAVSLLVRLATSTAAPQAKRRDKMKSWKDELRALALGGETSHMAA